ncbi:uncharacterized protein A1O5_07281 [Cladophialophora psammophila CBS 110553]|uniref:Threonylcarbamoyl-AMP synthase n=1 Tax=Cladophialophora psammophila CBS 110553 TaxID=1182543 RepID=W9WVZ9_9EURO|nr:uncharacterized protein A1O5_07281 [Cladophialophora psammophila CBS 110553]EXJ69245.1 hypothetical protein A1O5_07281 [Cladophialophora psammophila CBS 110553]
MGAPDVKTDARRVFEVISAGGIAIIPSSMGYALASSTTEALEKMFKTKRRGAQKRHAMGGNFALHQELHVMRPEHEEIVRCLTQDFDLPLAVIAKYDQDHPMFKHIDQPTMEALTVDGTLAMLINGGALQDELANLMREAKLPLLGSSANISGTGTKYVVQDINPEILDIADIVIDYGLVKFGYHGRSSTMIDFSGPKPEIVRIGVCYDVIKDHLKRFWDIEIPPDPGMSALPSGHLKTLPPLESLEKLVSVH